MANHPSAEKRDRQRVKRTARNKSVISAVRTSVRKAREAIASGDQGAADAVKAARCALARAASKGIVHHNAASRTTSRIDAQLAKRAAG
jgi:small subunit ribosomal protein S20